ncbi:MAG TPA: YlcI/YnfO family protein [Novimethylophilus sp.]|jgi:hypothetical protein
MGTTSNYALRLPASLKQSVERAARDDGTSLNQFIVTAIAEKLAAIKTADYFQERAKRGNLDAEAEGFNGVDPACSGRTGHNETRSGGSAADPRIEGNPGKGIQGIAGDLQ